VIVPAWCGHGSVFTWNPEHHCWDEFDTVAGYITGSWYHHDPTGNLGPIFAPNGNANNPLRAAFLRGKFTPLGELATNLVGTVINTNSYYSIAMGWFGHTSLFIWNVEGNSWDEYDDSIRKITNRWY
jgi:hypothetical protein